MRESGPAGQPRARGTHSYWGAQLAGWSVYAVVVAVTAHSAAGLPAAEAVTQALLLGAVGAAASHILYLLIHRFALRSRSLFGRLLSLAGLIPLLSIPAAALNRLLGLASWQTSGVELGVSLGPGGPAFLVHAMNWSLLLSLWSAAYFGAITLRDRASARLHASELARALQAAELRLLKSQLNPHFLFNALNTVRALISEDPALAQKAVTQLARTLRYTLNAGIEELMPLERELAIVEDYLAIEALRLGPRLRLERSVDPAAHGALIPAMLLQTLAENAIKHGIAELPQGGRLRLSAVLEPDVLLLTVENDRPRTPDTTADGEGVGLRNSRQRLRLLFGERAMLHLELADPDRAIATVRIPLQ